MRDANDIKNQRVLISPTSKASRRTRNRIREHGRDGFLVDSTDETRHILGLWGKRCWTFCSPRIKGARWFGHIPREEFHLECIGEEFFDKRQDW